MHTWYEQAVFYHIYPLGLLGAEKTNTLTETAHRLTELESWIPHISDLNGSAIYIGPLFESCTHGYDTTKILPVLCASAMKTESALWWTASSTIPDVSFSLSRISAKSGKLPRIRTGTAA